MSSIIILSVPHKYIIDKREGGQKTVCAVKAYRLGNIAQVNIAGSKSNSYFIYSTMITKSTRPQTRSHRHRFVNVKKLVCFFFLTLNQEQPEGNINTFHCFILMGLTTTFCYSKTVIKTPSWVQGKLINLPYQ